MSLSWTEERIDRLKELWSQGKTASHIADELGGVSRNAVIGKAHRLGLQSRPSPVKPNEPAPKAKAKPAAPQAEEKRAEPAPKAAPQAAQPQAQPAAAPAQAAPQQPQQPRIVSVGP